MRALKIRLISVCFAMYGRLPVCLTTLAARTATPSLCQILGVESVMLKVKCVPYRGVYRKRVPPKVLPPAAMMCTKDS